MTCEQDMSNEAAKRKKYLKIIRTVLQKSTPSLQWHCQSHGGQKKNISFIVFQQNMALTSPLTQANHKHLIQIFMYVNIGVS